MTLGPYALVLSYILSSADYSNYPKQLFVYRGMRMSKQLFRDQYGRINAVNDSQSNLIDLHK